MCSVERLKTQIRHFAAAHLQTHMCALAFTCTQKSKNNKENLVKGVGGEAARQKDINSLSEFNNRGGGGGGGVGGERGGVKRHD